MMTPEPRIDVASLRLAMAGNLDGALALLAPAIEDVIADDVYRQ